MTLVVVATATNTYKEKPTQVEVKMAQSYEMIVLGYINP